MRNLFEFAETFFQPINVDEKLALTHQAWHAHISGELTTISDWPVLPIDLVTFPERPELLAPRQMPRRKLTTTTGVAAFFHAIAHVEFVATSLSWAILYRFLVMPYSSFQACLRVSGV